MNKAVGIVAAFLLGPVGSVGAAQHSPGRFALTATQELTIYQDVYKPAPPKSAPVPFTASLGSTVPSSIQLRSLPNKVVDKMPKIAGYKFAVVRNEVLLVDFKTKRIIDILIR
jgi:hypothetical protein